MSTRRKISQLVLTAIVLFAVGLAGFGFFTFQRSLAALNQASQEDISWSVTQLEIELMRFRDSLRVTDGGADTSVQAINHRFDVLWSRVGVFQHGRIGKRLEQYDTDHLIDRLVQTLNDQEVAVVSLAPYDFASMTEIHRAFLPFSEEVRDLRRRAFIGEEALAAGVRKQMRSSAEFTLYLSIISVVAMVLALIYLSWQGRRFKKLAERNYVLACEAQDANLAKSRFLTMMSHELRTPMNGVLGLLALVRQTQVNEAQERLLGQANRSAQTMIDMLTDILDYSALEGNDISIEQQPFAPRQLAIALEQAIAPETRHDDGGFSVQTGADCPERLNGDFNRLRQSFAHLVTYFTETAGTGQINLKLDYEGGDLVGRINLEYAPQGENWTPDLIFGGRDEGVGGFAADALGPALARGLIRNMGGTIALEPSTDGEICVLVRVPLEVAKQAPVVRIKCEVRSQVLRTLCRSALDDGGVQFVDDESSGDIAFVMLEAGSADEAAQVAKLRQMLPDALIIAVGTPTDAGLFDHIATMPLNVEQLRKTVFERLAS